MFRIDRRLLVTCIVASLIGIPWHPAHASEPSPAGDGTSGEAQVVPAAITEGQIWSTAYELVATESRLLTRASQSVATTNEPKLLLGVIAGALVVSGVAMLAYGNTSSCKANHPTDSFCDRSMVLGAVGLSSGVVMLTVWALSR